MRNIILLITAIFLISCGRDFADDKDYHRHMKAAQGYYQQNQYRASIIEAKNALKLNGEKSDAYSLLAKIYNDLGMYSYSRKLIEPKLEKFPELTVELVKSDFYENKYNSVLELSKKYPVKKENLNEYIEANKYLAMALLQLGDEQGFEAIRIALGEIETVGNAAVFLEAYKYSLQGDLSSAKNILQKIPESEMIFDEIKLLSVVSIYLKDFPLADKSLTNALMKSSTSDVLTAERLQIFSLLIDVLIQQGRTSEAMTYQKILAEANPDANAARQEFNKAKDFFDKGDMVQAYKILTELQIRYPSDRQISTLLAMIEFQQGDNSKAIELFDKFIDPETASNVVLQAAAIAKYRTNNMDDAIELLATAAKKQPNNAFVIATYGLALLEADSTNLEGAKHLERSLALDPAQQRLRLPLARYHLEKSQPKFALAHLEKAYKEFPDDLIIQQSYFKTLYDLGNKEELFKILDTAISENKSNARFLFFKAWYLAQEKDYKQAEEYYKKSININNEADTQLSYSGLAMLYRAQGNNELVLSSWESAILQNTDSTLPYIEWYKEIYNRKLFDYGLNFLKTLKEKSDAWQISYLLADIELNKKDLSKSIKYIDDAMTKSGQLVLVKNKAIDLYTQRGDFFWSQNNLIEARHFYMKVLELSPQDYSVIGKLVNLEVSSGNAEEAQKILNSFSDNQANLAAKHFLQSVIYFAENKMDAGLKELRLSWSERPTDRVGDTIYHYYVKANQRVDAETFLAEWAQKVPVSLKAIILLASQYEKRKDYVDAIFWYEKGLLIDENNPIILNNLAWIYHLNKDSRAQKLSEKAANIQPNSAAVLDTHGWILVSSGKVPEGIEFLKRALSLSPDNEEIKQHLHEANKML